MLDWWFLYCYYCSVYITVLLSLDRYLHTAKAMMLLRINYSRILKRAILGIFAVMLVVTLPHLLGSFVWYYHGSHMASVPYDCPPDNYCNSPPSDTIAYCNLPQGNMSSSDLMAAYSALKNDVCDQANRSIYRGCAGEVRYVRANSLIPTINVLFEFYHSWESICTITVAPKNLMRHDPVFVKAVYLGVDLPFRYIIPSLALVVLNIALVRSVLKAQQSHSDIRQTSKKSLLDLPVLRSALGIVFVFLICHTGGAGLFALDLLRALANSVAGAMGTTLNVFLDPDSATQGLEMKYIAFLLAAVNSAINIVLYCFFLPTFRRRWASFFKCNLTKCLRGAETKGTEYVTSITLEELNTLPLNVSGFDLFRG